VGRCDDSGVQEERPADVLASADEAFRRGDFEAARDLYTTSLADDRSAEALDGLGQSLWFLCEIEDGIAFREDAYAEYRRRDDFCRAGQIALWLSLEQATSLGNAAAANGWFKRAERLLDDAPLCAAHAELQVAHGYRCGDHEEAGRCFQEAIEIGRRLEDPDSEIRGLNALGFHKAAAGDVEAGLALLDEAMAAALGGEAKDPWAIGATCCSVLYACEQISDLRRAAEWAQVVIDFTERRRFIPLSAFCRTIYAGILIASGEWERAEAELNASLSAYRGFGRPLAAYPLARLTELRVRQGRVEEARELLSGWEDHPDLGATVASQLLALGEPRRAAEKAGALLERGPTASLLVTLVSAELAAGDASAAASAAERLMELAHRVEHLHVLAAAELTAGRVASARGDPSAAQHLGSARDLFNRLAMPFDEASARLELAKLLAEEEPESAVAQARAALDVFDSLGAATAADETAALLRELGARGRRAPRSLGELTKRELEVLALLEQGLSNKEIAARLYIAPKTASHHVSSVLTKLGVRSRAEAAAVGARERAERMGHK
jgi:DNA-binding CsgD family transcriptional regulator/tetratricopeptide (TPR) repeat protein